MAQSAEILLEGGTFRGGPRITEGRTPQERRQNQIRKQLVKEIGRYSEIRGMSSVLIGEMLTYPEIVHMNIPTIVGALVIIDRIRRQAQQSGQEANLSKFPNIRMDDIIQNLIAPDLRPDDRKIATIKHKTDLLRYASMIVTKRESL